MGDHVQVCFPSEAIDDPEHLELALDVEPVSALDLDGGGAEAEGREDVPPARLEEIVFRGGPDGTHRREDAAPLLQDFQIGGSGHAQVELRLAPTGEAHVGVGVDEAGNHGAAPAVDDLVHHAHVRPAPHPTFVPHVGDHPVFDHEGALFMDADASLVFPGRGGAGVGGGIDAGVFKESCGHVSSPMA